MKALTFSEFGSSEVLEYRNLPEPPLEEAHVLVEMKAIGLNYADIYRRRGNYHLKGSAPYIAGFEGAGTVIKSRSDLFNAGDPVAFADVPYANAEYVAVPESHIIPLPDSIAFQQAASVLLQGLTAQYLAFDGHQVKAGETVVIHAASGGVGQFLTQICKMQGARVIGLSRNEQKLDIIRQNKADHALLLGPDWTSKVMELTRGKGVDVVFDSIGSTLKDSMDVARECGHIVFYGMSGGNPDSVDPRVLMDSSKTLSGGDLWSYLKTHQDRKERADTLFSWIRKGDILIAEPTLFKLSEGKKAHDFLESGKSAGKVLMIPDQHF